MPTTIAATLDAVRVEGRSSHRALSITWLELTPAPPRSYDTFTEARLAGTCRITETSPGGTVPQLRVHNEGTRPVLLLDGEELIGAKQNRIVNLTILVGARSALDIPVSCVEQGRWHQASADFHSSDSAMFAEARAAKMQDVTRSMRTRGTRAADQGAVWSRVACMLESHGVQSPTSAMSDAFDSQGARLDAAVAAFQPSASAVGAVFIVAGVPVGLELFDSPEVLRLAIPKLVRSYLLNARESAEAELGVPTADAVGDFVTAIKSAPPATFPAIGLGADLRIEAGAITGSALALEDRIVHLAAFDTRTLGRA